MTTLREMAEAYADGVDKEVQRLKEFINQQQEALARLEDHAKECRENILDTDKGSNTSDNQGEAENLEKLKNPFG